MLRLIAAEWMKSRTRWLPYALLLFLFVGAGIQIGLFGVVAYHEEKGIPDSGFVAGAYTFHSTYAIIGLLDAGQYWGPVFIAFFVASAVATDFGWGSVRLSIARGVTRTEFLAAKLVTTALICTVGMFLALAVGMAFSLLATQMVDDPSRYATLFDSGGPPLADVPQMIARAALAILPYGMLAFMLAVLSRSTAMGATGVLMYKLVEGISVDILGALGGIWAPFRNLFIERHASALMAVNGDGYPGYNSAAFRGVPDAAELGDPWVAALMLVLFCIVFGAVSFWSFAHRDLNSRE